MPGYPGGPFFSHGSYGFRLPLPFHVIRLGNIGSSEGMGIGLESKINFVVTHLTVAFQSEWGNFVNTVVPFVPLCKNFILQLICIYITKIVPEFLTWFSLLVTSYPLHVCHYRETNIGISLLIKL